MGRKPKPPKQLTEHQQLAAELLSSGKALVVRDGTSQVATTHITPAGLQLITALAAEGNDQATIAYHLGMHRKTFTENIKRDPAVDEAYAVGKALLANTITHNLLKLANAGNVVANIFIAKARLGWIEGSAPDTKPNVVINLPDCKTPEAYLESIKVLHQPQLKGPDDHD
jgi:hypothetical protein